MSYEPFSIKKHIQKHFLLPIQYGHTKHELSENIATELELTKSIDEKELSIYDTIYNPTNIASSTILSTFAKTYSNNVDFLKETQQLIKSLKKEDINTIRNKHEFSDNKINDIVSLMDEIKNDSGFHEKYSYIDWTFAKDTCNNNPFILQLTSIYNICSPILTLLVPIFVLIIPFIVVKLQFGQFTLEKYIEILKTLISSNSVYKAITEFNNTDITNGHRVYLILSASLYIFSIYQNILHCVRFYANIQKINTALYTFKKYIAYTLDVVSYYHSKSNKLTNYDKFNSELMIHYNSCKHIYKKLEFIDKFDVSINKVSQLGNMMYLFYQLYDNEEYLSTISYSLGFNGYFDLCCTASEHVSSRRLVKTSFRTNKKKRPVFKNMYYPKFICENEKSVKNDCDLTKNMVMSGPNASGKTTTLKSVFINILLSQQIGYGCFDSLKLTPIKHFYCYLNIPDTSGRDSLFQAEARRCSDIIKEIESDDEYTHFCIFDELYSGTNPDEASKSAYAFIKYLARKKNACFMLTTHYIDVCKKLLNNDHIENKCMGILETGDDFEYTYKIKQGISEVRGGIKVLKELDYPEEMLVDI